MLLMLTPITVMAKLPHLTATSACSPTKKMRRKEIVGLEMFLVLVVVLAAAVGVIAVLTMEDMDIWRILRLVISRSSVLLTLALMRVIKGLLVVLATWAVLLEVLAVLGAVAVLVTMLVCTAEI